MSLDQILTFIFLKPFISAHMNSTVILTILVTCEEVGKTFSRSWTLWYSWNSTSSQEVLRKWKRISRVCMRNIEYNRLHCHCVFIQFFAIKSGTKDPDSFFHVSKFWTFSKSLSILFKLSRNVWQFNLNDTFLTFEVTFNEERMNREKMNENDRCEIEEGRGGRERTKVREK